jgi:glycosyltransferase involved in cell wall biosynthesis
MPAVSVCLCCYNSELYLEETIQSVLAQTYKDWELVIVNDGSTDNTEKIIQKFINQGHPIKYRYQANTGLGIARNVTLSMASGEWIAFIDHDDVWLPEKLEMQMALFDTQPELGLVYSDSYIIKTDGERLVTTFLDNYGKYAPARGHILDELLIESCFIPLLSVVVRQRVLADVGGFNPDYNIVEDYDLWLRIAAKYPFDFVPQPTCSYRFHTSSAMRAQKEQYFTEYLELLGRWLNHPRISATARIGLKKQYLNTRYAYIYWLFKQNGRKNKAGQLLLKTVFNEPTSLFSFELWKQFLASLKRNRRNASIIK